MQTPSESHPAQVPPPQPNTPDVTLAFSKWLHKVRGEFWRHGWFDVHALREVILWDFGEDGGCYHHYKSQHEKVTRQSHQYPASHDNHTTYYDEPTVPQHRPAPKEFSKHNWSYPLSHTRNIFQCGTCSGSGQVRCSSCSGSGRCSSCRGSGHTGSGQNRRRCGSCGGSGQCSTCGGSGRVTCRTCNGEGMLLTYTSLDYRWWADEDEETIVSPTVDRFGVKSLITRVRQKGGSVRIAEFSANEVLATTGVLNGRIQELIQHAESHRRQLEGKIAGRSDAILFQQIDRTYIPLLYINLFAGRRYGQCFVAGTTDYQHVQFPMPVSFVKRAAWAALAAAIALLAFGLTEWLYLGPLLVFLVGLTGWGIWSSVRAQKVPLPVRWVLFDDDQYRAWQLAYLLAQAVSRARTARILDPWFTSLLEPPQADSIHSRNSFVFTLEQGRNDKRQRTELLVAGKRAQEQYAPDVCFLTANATRLIFLAGDQTPEVLAERIRDVLTARATVEPKGVPPKVEVVIVTEGVASPEDFPGLADAEGGVTIRLLFLPLEQMCEEARTGQLSDATLSGYQNLLEFSGFTHEAVPLISNGTASGSLQIGQVDGADGISPPAGISPTVASHLAARWKQDQEEQRVQRVGLSGRQP